MTLERARVFLENSLPELENYILSDTLYWQVGADSVPLTIGNILFEIRVVSAYDRTASRSYEDRISSARFRWAVNWVKKAEREYANRLKLWTDFLNESVKDGQIPAAYLKTNARHRAILTILDEQVDLSEAKQTLALSDAILRSKMKNRGFIWDPTLQAAFPRDEFWYLY